MVYGCHARPSISHQLILPRIICQSRIDVVPVTEMAHDIRLSLVKPRDSGPRIKRQSATSRLSFGNARQFAEGPPFGKGIDVRRRLDLDADDGDHEIGNFFDGDLRPIKLDAVRYTAEQDQHGALLRLTVPTRQERWSFR